MQLDQNQRAVIAQLVAQGTPVPSPQPSEPVSKTVYSIYWPETRAVVEALWNELPHGLYENPHLKHQEQMHPPFLECWQEWSGINLEYGFPYAYPTAGSSEAIKDLLVPPKLTTLAKDCGPYVRQTQTALDLLTLMRTCAGCIHVFDGEYEGYRAIAEARGLSFVMHPRSLSAIRLAPNIGRHDVFWISNPSAIDGEYWDEFKEFLRLMQRLHPTVRIYVDVAYVGVVKTLQAMNLADHPNVHAVIFSLSKPFGVYYHRIGGVFSRSEIPSLYGNAWFKNVFSLLLGRALMQCFPVDAIPKRYALAQEKLVADLIAQGKLPSGARPSNAVLLAVSPNDGNPEYARGNGVNRYCLTPSLNPIVQEMNPCNSM